MLIKAMAANCPAATQGLLRGCVSAYQLADKFETMSSNTAINHIEEVEHTGKSSQIKDIIRTSVEVVECLASLSPTVAMHVIRILKKANVMDGLVLSLLIKRESTDAASYLIDKLVLSSGATDTSRLYKELAEDKELAENARRFISQRMIISYKADDINLDKISLLTKSYTLLVYFIGVGSGSSDGSGSKLVEDSMNAIRLMAPLHCSDTNLPAKYTNDDPYKNAMCAAIVTCCRYPPIGDSSDRSVPAVKACLECFSSHLLHPESIESVIFSSRLSGFLIDGDAKSLLSVVYGTMLSSSNSNECQKEEDVPQITSVCHWLSSEIESDQLKTMHSRGMTMTSLAHDPIVAAEAMRRSAIQTTNELDDLAKSILSDQDTCAKIIKISSAVTLIKESVSMLVRRPEPHIPIVLPLSLERLAQALPWKEVMNGIQESTSHLFSQFILQLVYALEFLKHQPDSPFVVSPRSLPLKETLDLLDLSGQKDSDYKDLHTALKDLCSVHCPDIVKAIQQEESDDDELVGGKHAITPTMVSEAIRECLNEDAVDPSGLRAERMFLHSRQIFPQLEVDTLVVMEMLSDDDNSRSKYFSYVSLCKDPLLLLKARASVWKLRGTRRILLKILDSLMLANECIATEQSSSQIVAQDYLTSRDAIIVRCIVFACQSGFTFSGCENEVIPRARHCALCVSIVQSIILKRRGVMTVLIRQGLPEKCIDWIVEFIPDCLSDGPIITALLSDKSLLSATERLNAASAGLQIAVAHYHLDESIAKELVVASMNVLLDSFTLVVGPMGIPVSVLREENGQDITSICKTEMFHMLKTLSTISPKNIDLKNEACSTLSKISAMCKSENAASSTPRRKALLKEIWERCLFVNSKLGGALQL